MKICFLASASSIHTVRWVNALAERGNDVYLLTMHDEREHALHRDVNVHRLPFRAPFGYYLNQFSVRDYLKQLNPDVLHVHYASGYGTLARLGRFKRTILSVWGSDVYLFPYRSKRNERTLRKNLCAMTHISATSNALKKQTKKFLPTNRDISVIPFGIDLNLFQRFTKEKPPQTEGKIRIGTVKSLNYVYGIDRLLHAIAKLIEHLHLVDAKSVAERIQVAIVGEGPEKASLLELTKTLGIDDRTEFVGSVPNDEVPRYLNELDIYCAFSRSESFGVAVLEASACETPVVVSDVGGLPEVVVDGETGYIIDPTNLDDAVAKLSTLIMNESLRKQLGKNGRKFVSTYYEWSDNVTAMERLYHTV